jgi:3-mercaptopyruvate sulfurtransferase SseA
MPWEESLVDFGVFRAPVEIRAHHEAAGITPDKELVTYCQGGARAAHAALALKLAGYPNVRIYNGSWAEWGNDPNLPMESGSRRQLRGDRPSVVRLRDPDQRNRSIVPADEPNDPVLD